MRAEIVDAALERASGIKPAVNLTLTGATLTTAMTAVGASMTGMESMHEVAIDSAGIAGVLAVATVASVTWKSRYLQYGWAGIRENVRHFSEGRYSAKRNIYELLDDRTASEPENTVPVKRLKPFIDRTELTTDTTPETRLNRYGDVGHLAILAGGVTAASETAAILANEFEYAALGHPDASTTFLVAGALTAAGMVVRAGVSYFRQYNLKATSAELPRQPIPDQITRGITFEKPNFAEHAKRLDAYEEAHIARHLNTAHPTF